MTQLLDPLQPGAPLWPDLPAGPAPASDGPQPAPPESAGHALNVLSITLHLSIMHCTLHRQQAQLQTLVAAVSIIQGV